MYFLTSAAVPHTHVNGTDGDGADRPRQVRTPARRVGSSPSRGRPAPLKAGRRTALRLRGRRPSPSSGRREPAVPTGKQGSLTQGRGAGSSAVGGGCLRPPGVGRSGPASSDSLTSGSRRSLVVTKHTLHKLCRRGKTPGWIDVSQVAPSAHRPVHLPGDLS